jgi:hypothetical protein
MTEAFTSSWPERYLRGLFAKPDGVLVADFAVSSGWSSRDAFPRFVADANGDGFNDIIGFGYAGVVVSFGSARGTFSEPGVTLGLYGRDDGWLSNNIEPRFVTDMDGDAIADIVIYDGDNVNVRVGTTDGTFGPFGLYVTNSFFGPQQGWTSQEAFPRALGDVNGDGKGDHIGFGYAGTFVGLDFNSSQTRVVYDRPKLKLEDFGTDQGWISDNLFHRALADVNGDGADDIVGFGYAGTLVALADGLGGFHSPELALADFGQNQGWSSQDAFPRDLADVNGDGRADIVGFGIEGAYVAFGQTDGTFIDPVLMVRDFNPANGWTSNEVHPRILADFDNDGRIDIVGFGAEGVLVGYNTGGFYIG